MLSIRLFGAEGLRKVKGGWFYHAAYNMRRAINTLELMLVGLFKD